MSNWQTILAIDFDKWAARTYAANFPGARVECGPVSDYLDSLPRADVLLGGPPCQPFSEIGLGNGNADAKDGIPDFIAAVKRVRPRMFLMENVPGLMTVSHLAYVGVFLKALEAAGYVVQYRELNAADYGVAQHRRRVWFWGIRRNIYGEFGGRSHDWPRQTHCQPSNDPSFWGDLPEWISAGDAIEISEGAIRRVRGKGFGFRRDHPLSEPAPTLVCQKGGGGNSLYLIRSGDRLPLTIEHRRRLMSAPDDFTWPDGIRRTHQRLVLGNGWASRMGAVFANAFHAVDPESQTVIDLFCGGGIGAVGWHGRYWSFDEQLESISTEPTAMVGRGRE